MNCKNVFNLMQHPLGVAWGALPGVRGSGASGVIPLRGMLKGCFGYLKMPPP